MKYLTPSFILRIGIAFAFLYPAIASLINPIAWIGFLPIWTDVLLPEKTALFIFSWIEIAIGLGLLFLKNPIIPAIFAELVLIAIIIINWGAMDIIFRDISIILMVYALVLLDGKKKNGSEN